MPWMRVLVVGAGGFIGSHAVRRFLDRGDEVTALVRSRTRHEARLAGARVVEGLVEEPPWGADDFDFDCVVFAAGVWKPGLAPPANELRELLHRVWVVGVERLARLSLARGARFVLLSGITVHGKVHHPEPIRESTLPRYLCVFGRHKRLAEDLLARMGRERGLSWVALRPHEVYGSGDRSSIVHYFASLVQGRRFVHVGGGNNRWSLINVENLADAIELVARVPVVGPLLVADERAYTMNEVMHEIAAALGRADRFVHVPVAVAKQVAELARRIRPLPGLFNAAYVEMRAGDNVIDDSRARSIGYRPRASLAEGVRGTVASLHSAR
jgi:nucleoside-diphosphate-sugar epimerase